jgi:Domain of unknown function (DUF4157)
MERTPVPNHQPAAIVGSGYSFAQLALNRPEGGAWPQQPSAWMQPKLMIGAADDRHEQEADRVAQQVVQQLQAPEMGRSALDPAIQRQPKPEGAAENPLHRKPIQLPIQLRDNSPAGGAASPDLTSAINQARGHGQPLTAGLQKTMGRAMGADFRGVRVHTDGQADQLNRSIQAQAFTTGQDVFFRQGAYQPGSRSGQGLIAHELTHVVQQNAAVVQPSSLPPAPITTETPAARGPDRTVPTQTAVDPSPLVRVARVAASGGQPVIQREAELGSIQIEMSAAGTISNSHISTNERPEGAIKSQEGSHTTAWIVTAEGIRQAIQGKTIAQAIAAIDTLYTLAKDLPGVSRVDALSQERRGHLADIKGKVDTNKTAAATTPSLDTLQEYISALMAYRNALPLSASKRGALANSGAEAQSMDTLRNYQTNTAAVVRAAIFKLLDKKAIADFQANAEFEPDQDDPTAMVEVSIDNPGAYDNEADQNQRVIDIIEQHLKWVKGLFPAAYAKAGITDDHILDEFLFSGETDFGRREDIEDDVDIAPALPNNPPVPVAIPANDRFSTQIVLDDANLDQVAALIVTGRPAGVFGTQDRKHTTAWAVFVRGAMRKTEGKTLAEAVAGIKSLLTDAKAMPGAQDPQVNAMSDAGTARVQAALVAANAAQVVAENAIQNGTRQAKQNALQIFIHAYLAYRNALPLSAAIIPSQLSTSGGKAEPRYLAALDTFENRPTRMRTNAEKLAAAKAFWKLFDLGTLEVLTNDQRNPMVTNTANVNYKQNMPGVDQTTNKQQRVINILVQHILTMKSAYPGTTRQLAPQLSHALTPIVGQVYTDPIKIKLVANNIRIAVGWPRIR